MRTIPIIFSAAMIRALLDGRKTQTRRLAWRPYVVKPGLGPVSRDAKRRVGNILVDPSPWQKVKAVRGGWLCPRCQKAGLKPDRP